MKLPPLVGPSQISLPVGVIVQGPEGSKVAHEESVDSEEDSPSEEEGDQGSALTLRRSSRSTRGAPPKRFGFAFTHHLSALPRLNIPDFEFNL